MKQEDKDLLIKDLCARLPYGSKGKIIIDKTMSYTIILDVYGINPFLEGHIELTNIKPYLFPMSSMTEEQINELYKLTGFDADNDDYVPTWGIADVIDWLNAHHFDYRGLIDKGLAIDATNLNIY